MHVETCLSYKNTLVVKTQLNLVFVACLNMCWSKLTKIYKFYFDTNIQIQKTQHFVVGPLTYTTRHAVCLVLYSLYMLPLTRASVMTKLLSWFESFFHRNCKYIMTYYITIAIKICSSYSYSWMYDVIASY